MFMPGWKLLTTTVYDYIEMLVCTGTNVTFRLVAAKETEKYG